jgi:endo-1,4-beta-xylanase
VLSRAERLRFAAAGSALVVSVALALVAARGPDGAAASEPGVAGPNCAVPGPGGCAAGSDSMSGRGTMRPPLRMLAQPYGLRLGTAVNTDALANDPPYAEVVAREFGTLTAEDAMKWGRIEPTRGGYDWAAADQLVEFAARNGQQVYGHTLVWHEALPGWLTAGTLTSADAAALLSRHISDVVWRYRGRVWAWDVVNEPLRPDGSLRESIWRRALGPDYIERALRWARAADPNVRLFINDYGIEGINEKSDGLYALVKRLRARGVPIDGIGFQTHTTTERGLPSTFSQNLQRFAALGLDVAITEADVRIPLPVTEEKLAAQAALYADAVAACMKVQRCVSFTVWGFSDRYSWVPTVYAQMGAACVLDSDLQPKPAYAALTAAFPRRSGE